MFLSHCKETAYTLLEDTFFITIGMLFSLLWLSRWSTFNYCISFASLKSICGHLVYYYVLHRGYYLLWDVLWLALACCMRKHIKHQVMSTYIIINWSNSIISTLVLLTELSICSHVAWHNCTQTIQDKYQQNTFMIFVHVWVPMCFLHTHNSLTI